MLVEKFYPSHFRKTNFSDKITKKKQDFLMAERHRQNIITTNFYLCYNIKSKKRKHNKILYTKKMEECNHRRYEINYKGRFFKVNIQIFKTPSL